MMRGDYAFARAGEAATVFKEWATADTGATVIGVAGGVFIGEWVGTWLTNYFNIEDGWTKLIAKGIAKGGLSFVLFFIGRRMNPGIGRVFMQGMAAGPLVSIIGDLAEVVVPALGLIPGSSSTNITIKPAETKNIPTNVGNRSSVITTV